MVKYFIEMQFAEFRKHSPIIKVLHKSDCPELGNIQKDKLSGPNDKLEDAQKKAEILYPDVPIRRHETCF